MSGLATFGLALAFTLQDDPNAALQRERDQQARQLVEQKASAESTRATVERATAALRAWDAAEAGRSARFERAKKALNDATTRQGAAAAEAEQLALESVHSADAAYEAACDLGANAIELYVGAKLGDALEHHQAIRSRMAKMAETTLARHRDAATQAKYAKILAAHMATFDALGGTLVALHAAQSERASLEGRPAPVDAGRFEAEKSRIEEIAKGIEAVIAFSVTAAGPGLDPELLAFSRDVGQGLQELGALELIPFGDRYSTAALDFTYDWISVLRAGDAIGSGSPDPDHPRPGSSQADRALDSLRRLVQQHGDDARKHSEIRTKLAALATKYAANQRRIGEIETRLAEIDRILAGMNR